MNSFFADQKVLVTGACGTVGRELTRQLLEEFDIEELVAVDNNESEIFFLEQRHAEASNAKFILADIRDPYKVSRIMKDMDVVFHTAAFKHVVMCERSPFEAVQTNIIGVKNIINAAYKNKVNKVIFTSSDKAVNPTSVMGTSKLMGERLMTAANSNFRDSRTCFTSTRFGNVLGSRGSVIPIFIEQIKRGGPVTLTDSDMTRFIMSIKQAVRLVIDSASIAKGGEVFVTKMPVIRIKDLAEAMIATLSPQFGFKPADIPIKIIGFKAGEKICEELISKEEVRRTMELQRYFAVLPAFRSLYRSIDYSYDEVISNCVDRPYSSDNEIPLSRNQLNDFITANHLLDDALSEKSHPADRYWPDNGDKNQQETTALDTECGS